MAVRCFTLVPAPSSPAIARERALSVEDDETTPTTAASASKREDHRLHLMEKYATVWLKKTRAGREGGGGGEGRGGEGRGGERKEGK